jgi:hypothetical protein
LWFVAAVLLLPGQGYGEPEEAAPLPSFEELEALGAVIGTIRVDPRSIRSVGPRRTAGLTGLRIACTRHAAQTVAKQLLFKSGTSVRAHHRGKRTPAARQPLPHDVEIRPPRTATAWSAIDVITHDSGRSTRG